MPRNTTLVAGYCIAGLVLLVPSPLSLLAAILTVLGIEIQVRSVEEPYLRRTLPARVVRLLVEQAYAAAGRSQREMARLFHLTDFKEYKKLLDFLRRHRLSPRK